MKRAAVATALMLLLEGWLSAQAQEPQPQAPVFRTTVDVVAIDVQVVDRSGEPLKGLTPVDFEVKIDGKARQIVSVDLIEYSSVPPTVLPVRTPGKLMPDARVFIVAIDEYSFVPAAIGPAMQAARRFVQQLRPEDVVSIYAYPFHDGSLDLTHDHYAAERALDRVHGRRDRQLGMFSLTPSEIVDITADDQAVTNRVISRECSPTDPTCPGAVRSEAHSIAGYFEGQAAQSISSLSLLVRSLRRLPGRKTLVLMSGGVMTSDRTGGRPDVTGLFSALGEDAAASETNLYVLHWDTNFLETYSAANPTGTSASDRFTSAFRDSDTFRHGLDAVAGKSGGALLAIEAGTGQYAFDRVLRENTAYYLLGVASNTTDRDGRLHFINVKTKARGATVRSRTHVVIPSVPGQPAGR
ncbi:MAG TPA: VWA domain-containing protein [Vicinamibacterales bacterium]|nr:VWA domain-containing protein [Vicinamibacterales bacterium]